MLTKIIAHAHRVADCLTFLTFLTMTVGVLVSVIGRYLFRSPMPGGMELACFAMLWCAFLEAGNALMQDKHISMSLVKERLSKKAQARTDIIIEMVILITGGFLVRWSTSLAWESVMKNWRDAGSLAMPMVALYGVMSLGSVWLCVVALAKLIGNWQSREENEVRSTKRL